MTTRSSKLATALALGVALATSVSGMAPAYALDEASVSTSTTAGVAVGSGLVTATATAKAFRPARQNGQANLTIAYDCLATAVGAIRTHVPTCTIITDTGATYNDPSDITPGEVATSAGTITLPGSSAQICMVAAGRMALDDSLVQAQAPCRLIALAA